MAIYYLDMLGEICPHPLYGAQDKLEKMKEGDVLIIETDFSRSVRSLLAWADKEGFTFDVEEVENGVWQVKITKV